MSIGLFYAVAWNIGIRWNFVIEISTFFSRKTYFIILFLDFYDIEVHVIGMNRTQTAREATLSVLRDTGSKVSCVRSLFGFVVCVMIDFWLK